MTLFRKITPSVLLLLASEILLVLLFPGSLIFQSTLTAGGDTPSHFASAVAMNKGLFAIFSPVTWVHGAFAGYPLFLHYFPLPFALAAFISKVVSLMVAFKLVTLLAVIPLPAAVYLCLRRLGYGQNIPGIGAVLSLSFLLMNENCIWGGNIVSTLSGEFALAISLILYVIFTGKLYADISARKSLMGCSVLEALIALSHGYPLLQLLMGSSYFILWGRNLRALFKLHATAAGLAAFWLLPLLWRIHWNTPYSYGWHFKSWEEIAPPVFWPSFVGASIVAYSCIRNLFRPGRKLSAVFREPIESPELYLMWQFGCALIGFSIASFLRLVDIRFMPFAQIMLVMLGAVGWGRLLSGLPRPNLWSAAFCAGFAVLALTKAAAVDTWIQWNYSGMESKPLWNSYQLVSDYLSGDENSPRVVWEHNDITADTGSVRAFELLPAYSGRSVLEGLYMQSGINSPFVYYIQSELTQNASTPFPLYYYSRPNPARAAEHLRLFNVSQVIAVSDNIANSLDFSPDYELRIAIPPYRIYRLKGCGDSYVEPLRFRPLRIPAQNWKKRQFDWFRESSLSVPLVVAPEGSPGEFLKSLQAYGGDPKHLPEVPFPEVEEVQAHAVLGDGKITIDTSKPGHPLWIKVSYHPDWRITEGAGELYLASPAFMLLVPGTSKVVLTFDTQTGIYLWGKIFFALTIVLLILNIALRKLRSSPPQGTATPGPVSGAGLPAFIRRRLGRFSDHTTQSQNGIGMNAVALAAFAAMVVISVGAISTRNQRDPTLLYNFASDKFMEISENRSSPLALLPQDSPQELPMSPETVRLYKAFDKCIAGFGQTSVLDYSVLHKAFFMASWDKWDELQQMLEKFLEDNPENRTYPESLAWLGEASLKKGRKAEAERIFRRALFFWPEGRATERAGLRLADIIGADPLLETARGLFASGRYPEAYDIYAALALSKDKKTADESIISLAYCCFYMNRWNEASDLFMRWLGDNFDTPGSADIQADYKQCLAIIDQNKEWTTGPNAPPISPARKGLIVRLIQRVKGEK